MIAIKDFEMPESCRECEIKAIDSYGRDFCAITQTLFDYRIKIRPEDCPLVEIPDHVG